MSITAVILTFNEEQHLERCLDSLRGVVSRICIVDSFSTDRTTEIAKSHGVDVFQNPWKNYATQFQWGLDHSDIQTEWTMRIDADEYLESELRESIQQFVKSAPADCNAGLVRRKMVFLGRPITHGFFYPAMMLRLWRSGQGRIEQRWMDEHIVVDRLKSQSLRGDLVDANLNDLTWWINKHNGYATREVYDMVEILERRRRRVQSEPAMSAQAAGKRFLKEQVYSRLPATVRTTLYFIYRYFLGAGFLDGKEGFFFHFLQAYWYRTLVEAKLHELNLKAAKRGLSAHELLVEQGILVKEA